MKPDALTSNRNDPLAVRIRLRDLAWVREIDRQLYSMGLKHQGMKWIVTPGLGVMGVLAFQRVLDAAASLAAVDVLVGMLGLLPATIVYIETTRRSRTEVAALESERASLVSATRPLSSTRTHL